MALSSCCHTLFLLYHRHCSECLVKSTSSLQVSACSAVNKFLTMYGRVDRGDRDTPALFYRFPITTSIHYMCQTIYHDSHQKYIGLLLSLSTMCFIIIIDLLFLLFLRLMMITFLALSIIVLLPHMSEHQSEAVHIWNGSGSE